MDDFVKNNILCDAGYDSNQIRDKVISSNIGKLLTAKNKDKLASLKLSPEKILLKERIKIEHTNARLNQYKKLSVRYDKYSYNYNMFLHLACINLILNRTNLE